MNKPEWSDKQILEAVEETDRDRAAYVNMISHWTRMWNLDDWTDEERQAAEDEKRRLVTTSFPRNVAKLANQMVLDVPDISVPCYNGEDDANARQRERFLLHSWDAQRSMRKMPPFFALRWSLNVLGRAACKVQWVGRNARFPILIRPLRPENVGVEWGETGPLWAYHCYSEKVRSLKQRFAAADSIKFDDDREVEVIDFWYAHSKPTKKGMGKENIYNAIMVREGHGASGSFLLEPEKKRYPYIPIFEAIGDPAFTGRVDTEANSIFAGTEEDWHNMNLAASLMMTGMEREFFAQRFITSEFGHELTDVNEGPGQYTPLPAGADIKELQGGVNVGLAQAVYDQLRGDVQQSTFNDVLFGNAGNVAAGYAISNLANAARGRMHANLKQLETLVQDVNSLKLCFVDKFAGARGVELWGYDEAEDNMIDASLNAEQVNGFYVNRVKLTAGVVGDELQQAMLGLSGMQQGAISRRTWREDYLPKPARHDEEERINEERAMLDPDLFRAVVQSELADTFDLPAGEPDGQDTLAMQQQQAMQQAMQQQAQGLQPQQPMPQSGLPPEMQGQITPEMLGMMRQTDPALFAQMMGQPLSPEEQLQNELGIINA